MWAVAATGAVALSVPGTMLRVTVKLPPAVAVAIRVVVEPSWKAVNVAPWSWPARAETTAVRSAASEATVKVPSTEPRLRLNVSPARAAPVNVNTSTGSDGSNEASALPTWMPKPVVLERVTITCVPSSGFTTAVKPLMLERSVAIADAVLSVEEPSSAPGVAVS